MATLDLRTAGGGLTVAGLSEETASQLKALVVDRAGVAAAEESAEQ
jgi:membrane protein YdbS with pleckstrin-like domain